MRTAKATDTRHPAGEMSPRQQGSRPRRHQPRPEEGRRRGPSRDRPRPDGDFLIGRWRADGRYAGGFPGATAGAGTPVAFTGTDILRLSEGRLAEYWLNGDTLDLLRQLGAVT
jgi:hypothetical protein